MNEVLKIDNLDEGDEVTFDIEENNGKTNATNLKKKYLYLWRGK